MTADIAWQSNRRVGSRREITPSNRSASRKFCLYRKEVFQKERLHEQYPHPSTRW